MVAHPDDETIWLGGTILTFNSVDWTIFSLCRASDADRAPKFKRVCAFYKARPIIADMEDEGRLSLEQSLPLLKKIIKNNIKGRTFDYVFTHGANGEYGHPRHIGVHQAVKELAQAGQLAAKKIFYLNYKKKPNKNGALEIKKNTEFFLPLGAKIFLTKKRIMVDLYGFAATGIDVSYCPNPEGFRSAKLT